MAQRIFALWGSNRMVLKVLCFAMGTAYSGSIVVTALGKAVYLLVYIDSFNFDNVGVNKVLRKFNKS